MTDRKSSGRDGHLAGRPSGDEHRGTGEGGGGQRDGTEPAFTPPLGGQPHPGHSYLGEALDGGRRDVHAVGALVRIPAGDQVAVGVHGHQPVQQQPLGLRRVGEEQDLPGPQLSRRDGRGQHDVAGVDPRGHRAADDHVRRHAHGLWREGGDHQTGEAGEHQRRGHPDGGGGPGQDRAPRHLRVAAVLSPARGCHRIRCSLLAT